MARTKAQPKPTIFQLRLQTWIQNLLKFRFFMSLHKKFRERQSGFVQKNTLHRVWAVTEATVGLKCGVVSFYGLDNFIG